MPGGSCERTERGGACGWPVSGAKQSGEYTVSCFGASSSEIKFLSRAANNAQMPTALKAAMNRILTMPTRRGFPRR